MKARSVCETPCFFNQAQVCANQGCFVSSFASVRILREETSLRFANARAKEPLFGSIWPTEQSRGELPVDPPIFLQARGSLAHPWHGAVRGQSM